MKCKDAQAQLSAQADGRLSEELATALQSHCEECADCTAFQGALGTLRSTMHRAQAPEVPAGLAHRLAAHRAPSPRSWLPEFARLALPTAAFGFALAALLFVLASRGESTSTVAESGDVVDSRMNYEDLLASASRFGGEER